MLIELFSHDAPPEDPFQLQPFNESFTTTALSPQFSTTSTWSIRIQLIPQMGIYNFNGIALFVLPILCLTGLIGNFMVCVAIATDRRLHNVTNYFLFSLALADLLVCCIVMPLSIVVEVRQGVWTWSVSMCLLYVYSDVFLCSASIVHMSVISLDRYLGISQPLHTRNKSKTLIFVKIAIVWAVTLLVSSPIAVLAMRDTDNILQSNQCMIFSRYYIVYGSTMTFLIPFCIMAVTYVRTTQLLNKQASILSQKADDRLNGNGLRRTMPHRKLGYARTNSATVNGTYANGKAVAVNSRTMSNISNVENGDMDRLGTSRPSIINGHKQLEKASTINRWRSRTSNYLTNFANKVGRRNSLQAATQELANEHKATRVLAVVFSCFFICWTPFFAVNFVIGFCGSGCEIPPWLGSLFLWLGYISSTINPIIYTVFNKRFRQAFVRILRCQCFHPLRDSSHTMYSRNFTTTIVPDTYTCSRSTHERNTSVVVRDETRSARNSDRLTVSRAKSEVSDESADKSQKRLSCDKKKISLPTFPRSSLARDSRATTEETTTTEEESKPLLPKNSAPAAPSILMSPIRKSVTSFIINMPLDEDDEMPTNNAVLTTSLLNPQSSATSSQPIRSYSCVDCKKADRMLASDMTDNMTTSSASTSSASNGAPRRHLTLFNQLDNSIKETFL